jgi:hypothetical protein
VTRGGMEIKLPCFWKQNGGLVNDLVLMRFGLGFVGGPILGQYFQMCRPHLFSMNIITPIDDNDQ